MAGHARLVHTEWLLRQVVSTGGVGASATSHADIPELAATTLPFQVPRVAKLMEHDRVLPDVREGLLAQVSGQGGQVATRIDLALVRHETDTGSRQTALGHRIHVAWMACCRCR